MTRITKKPAFIVAGQLCCMVTFIIVLGCLTYYRNTVWADSYSLWMDVLSKRPTARAYSNLATAYKRDNRLPEAIAMNKKSLTAMPNAPAFNNLGNIFLMLGRYGEALKQFSLALELQSDSAESYNGRGIAHFNLGRYHKALADYSQAIMLAPSFAEAHINLANLYDETDMHFVAFQEYEKAISIDSSHAGAYYNRGILLLRMGNLPDARKDFQNACFLGSAQACEVYMNSGKKDLK